MDLLIISGGDGTFHRLMDRLVKIWKKYYPQNERKLRVVLIGSGTRNDMHYSMGNHTIE